MRFKSFKLPLLALLLVILALLCIRGTLAWFTSYTRLDAAFSAGMVISYFAGGTGTETDPYIIQEPVHLYNLAWLQNNGYFADTEPYFILSDTSAGKTPVVLDMGGALGGSAIPPIGTEYHPFVGHLNGNGSVIQNLWVSTMPEDWREQPEGENAFSGQYVGLFGRITNTAEISDLVLDRLEVKTHVEDSVVGLVCGYADARLENIGVFNGILTTGANASTGVRCASNYSLVGDIAPDLWWEDMPEIDLTLLPGADGSAPSGTGNGLSIDPKEFESVGPLEGTNARPVHLAIPGTAYYTGYSPDKIKTGTPSPLLGSIYDMTNNGAEITEMYINNIGDSAKQNRLRDVLDIVKPNDPYSKILTINAYENKKKLKLPFGSAANVEDLRGRTADPGNTVQVPAEETGAMLTVPAPGIWFKPKVNGTAALAFTLLNQSQDRYMMVYKIRRSVEGEQETISVVDAKEFSLPSTIIGNAGSVYYEYEVEAEQEYFISWSGINNHAPQVSHAGHVGFTYLHITGTHELNGPLPGHGGDNGQSDPESYHKSILGVDYLTWQELTAHIEAVTAAPEPVKTVTVTPLCQTLLRFQTQETSPGGSLYFTAASAPPQEAATVYYYSTANSHTVVDFSTEKDSGPGTAENPTYYRRSEEADSGYQSLFSSG